MIIHTKRKRTIKPSTNEGLIVPKPLLNNEDAIVKFTKKKNKKITSTPIAVEEPIIVEEKTEDEDLSKWLEEHTED